MVQPSWTLNGNWIELNLFVIELVLSLFQIIYRTCTRKDRQCAPFYIFRPYLLMLTRESSAWEKMAGRIIHVSNFVEPVGEYSGEDKKGKDWPRKLCLRFGVVVVVVGKGSKAFRITSRKGVYVKITKDHARRRRDGKRETQMGNSFFFIIKAYLRWDDRIASVTSGRPTILSEKKNSNNVRNVDNVDKDRFYGVRAAEYEHMLMTAAHCFRRSPPFLTTRSLLLLNVSIVGPDFATYTPLWKSCASASHFTGNTEHRNDLTPPKKSHQPNSYS